MRTVPATPCLALFVLLLPGCFVPRWHQSERVVARRDLLVEVERFSLKGEGVAQGFDHPTLLDLQEVTRILAGLTYTDRGSRDPAPVVSEGLTSRLAAAVVEGLTRADASERVRFTFNNPARTLWILPTSTTTRGVAFVKPAGVLNVAFDVIDGRLDFEDPVWADPTRKTKSSARLVPSGTASLYGSGDGDTKRLWITAPVRTAPVAKPSRPATIEPIEPEPDAAPSRPEVPEPAAPSPPPESDPLSDEEVLRRLRALEKSYRDGTITEEEYRLRKEKLLFPDG